MNATIQNHLAARRIEVRAADHNEVVGFWQKAVTAYGDARNTSSSLDNRLLRAYDAGRIAALALVRAHGYRTRGGESHHYVTFDVARSLVSYGDLRTALDEMNGLRTLRHAVEYEAEDDVDGSTVQAASRIAERVINLAAVHLRAVLPDQRHRIRKLKPRGDGGTLDT